MIYRRQAQFKQKHVHIKMKTKIKFPNKEDTTR